MTVESTTAAHLIGRRDLTVDDLELLPDEMHCELWDGRLVLLPSEPTIHQLVMRRIASALDERCPESALVVHRVPIELDRHNVLRPDLVVLRAESAWRSPAAADVLLVGEVTSSVSEATDRGAKMQRFASAGISSYWIVDQIAARVTITVHRIGPEGHYLELRETDELVTLDEPWRVTLDLPAWTRKRDRLRLRAAASAAE